MLTPRENFKRRLEGKKPEWIPIYGMRGKGDSIGLYPRMNKEFIARHFVIDGEGPYEYGDNIYKSDWFDLEWEFVPQVGGATVHPGAPKVPDITRWEDFVSVPTIDMFNFEECAEKNKGYFDHDYLCNTVIMTGFWERLMSLMDVENAAVALIDDDEKEGVHRLFDQLSDFYCRYFTRMNEVFHLDMVQVHDDWGHQRSTFFSPDTAREMIAPYFKKIADCVHAQGMSFELHSCGNNAPMIPVYIEMGIDMWAPQLMNDYYGFCKQYKDEKFVFGIHEAPQLAMDAPEELVIEEAHKWVDKYIDYNVVASIMPGLPDLFTQEIKNYSMKLLADR